MCDLHIARHRKNPSLVGMRWDRNFRICDAICIAYIYLRVCVYVRNTCTVHIESQHTYLLEAHYIYSYKFIYTIYVYLNDNIFNAVSYRRIYMLSKRSIHFTNHKRWIRKKKREKSEQNSELNTILTKAPRYIHIYLYIPRTI